MKISLININLVAEDAIGTCMVNQVRFFSRRGDDVHVYIPSPPHHVPADIAAVTSMVTLDDLIGGQQEHFRLSDLYIYHYPGYYDLLESVRRLERGTVIFYYHNVTPPELWGTDVDRESLINSVRQTNLAHYADLAITVSPFNKQDLVERAGYAPDRIHVLPLAVPLEEFTPGDQDIELAHRYNLEGQRVLLYVGRMAGNKRIDLLIEALAQVKDQVPNVKLMLVGDEQSNPAYCQIVAAARARAEELGVAEAVIWTGRVDELLPYYRLADVYVTASLHEGFGVPLIEAMACGVPVVASRAGAMPWVLGNAGLLCKPGDAASLAAQALRVLQDADLRQDLVNRGLKQAQRFGLENYEAGLVEIVDQAVAYTMPDIPPDLSISPSREETGEPVSPFAQDQSLLGGLTQEIEAHSDVAQRGYLVRSKVPLVGPLIAWVRRNLTSHLREPYLDPMIERQVAQNRRMAEWLNRAGGALAVSARRQAGLEARIRALEAQTEALARRLKEKSHD
jgi:glycosyltransferase involved in cell wall biosynthesis